MVVSMPMREVTINGSLKKYLVKGRIEDNEKLVVTGNLSCQYYTTELGPPRQPLIAISLTIPYVYCSV